MKKFSWEDTYKKKPHWATGKSSVIDKFFLIAEKFNLKGKVLDIGCGTGEKTSLIAKKFDTTGIDISKTAIKKAKKKYKNIRFKAENAEKLSFKSNSFDAVFSNAVLQFTDLRKSAKEIFRILKPNGIACLSIIVQTISRKKTGKDITNKTIRAYRKLPFKFLEKDIYNTIDKEPFIHEHKIINLILIKRSKRKG